MKTRRSIYKASWKVKRVYEKPFNPHRKVTNKERLVIARRFFLEGDVLNAIEVLKIVYPDSNIRQLKLFD